MGSDAIALPMLNWLAGEGSGAHIVAVFTQPDRPVGRGQKVQPNAIKLWAHERGIPVHQPERLREAELATLASCNADLALVMAYGHILRDAFINAPRLGTLNFHTSLLPKYRGASPIQTAVASGESTTGVTLMRIVAALDAGPVADVERVEIGPRDTALSVETKLAAACVPLIARALPKLAAGTQEFREQDHAGATFCRKLEKADGALDFTRPAAALAARINGLFPWPATTVEIAGQPIKFGSAEVCNLLGYKSGEPGCVLGADREGLLVATGAGALRVLRLQRPGGKMLEAGEFLRGFPIVAGTLLPSQPMPELVGAKPFPRPPR
ncbi:MAG: methionyl-tRNA formyltransferase [Candidatus Didemnitutus sp.]|nr:methionyl-tRNA formyltransferase [Candidatus Didemnitutus sp.]